MVRISDTERQRTHAREAPSAGFGERRNPGMELDLDWVLSARANLSAIERRADTLTKRRTVKKQWQAAWLLRAITLMT